MELIWRRYCIKPNNIQLRINIILTERTETSINPSLKIIAGTRKNKDELKVQATIKADILNIKLYIFALS